MSKDRSLKAENEETVGGNYITVADPPADASPRMKLAVKLCEMNNANSDHLVGVLCTLVETSLVDKQQAKAFKDLLRRELYNAARDRVELIHSIVGRAEVESFREYPTLEEQLLQPSPDRYVIESK